MDIYGEVKSFSFYESSGSVYANVKIIEKRLKKNNHDSKNKFEEAEIGELITLRTDREKLKENNSKSLESLVQLLLNRLLIFDITDWEPATKGFKNSNPKFLFTNLTKCVTLTEK